MDISVLKCKLHMACVTRAELWYDGSCAIDADLAKLAGLYDFEKIDIYNVTNGERFSTYVIIAEAGSRTISMNGAAARRVQIGDRVIIAAYAQILEAQAATFRPRLIYLNDKNFVENTANTIPRQIA
jgi:aspartate 1-decarboxylase